MRLVRLLLPPIAALAGFLVPAAPAAALSYPVTSLADTDSKGTLRASVKEANAHMGADTIPIEVSGTIELGSALQIVFDPVSIVGPGADLLEVRRAGGAAAFSVFAFSTDADPSSISGLTVSNGQAVSSGGFAQGGGIRNVEGSLTLDRVVVRGSEATTEGGTDAVAEGGGVFSEGPLRLRETEVVGNAARAGAGTSSSKAFGGGVAALGELIVERSTISGNVVEANGAGGLATAQGGGLLTSVPTRIELSTISGNSADARNGGTQTRAMGGGIKAYESDLTSVTLAGNSATSSELASGANLDSFLTTALRNSILAEPLGNASSCAGLEIVSGGYNLDEGSSCGFGQGSDINGLPAGLDPVLRDNGGPTPTHALLAGSLAIDRGKSFGDTADQRGLPRPVDFAEISNKEGGDGADIGAFELQVPSATAGGGTPVLVTQRPGDRRAPQTRILSGPPRVTYKTKAKFRFASSEAQSRFECKLDSKKWKGCANPFKRMVKPGRHLFKVRAIDRSGNVDPTPAQFGWRVKPIVG